MHQLLVEVEVNENSVTEKDQEWDEIINAIGGYFKHADSCSFELPERNAIWSRPETGNLLESFNMRHQALVRLCKPGCQNTSGFPIGKTLKFVSNSISFSANLHSKLSTCTCQTHAELNQVNYTETAFYNRKLARYILVAIKNAAKKWNLRLKGGRKAEVDVFVSCACFLHVVWNKRCQGQTGVSQFCFWCQFHAECFVCAMRRATRNDRDTYKGQETAKPITCVMAVRHLCFTF